LLLLVACGQQPSGALIHSFAGPTMGSTYEVKFLGEVPVAKVRAEVESELAAVDRVFSLWRQDSEIAQFNAHQGTEPFAASPRLLAAVRLALELAERTGGAFDPTVQPLMQVYRQAQKTNSPIDEQALARAELRVGYRHLTIVGAALQKDRADLEIDLDGIVAGLCADSIAARLEHLGVHAFYLQITGEVLCHGNKGEGQPWRIGIRDPVAAARMQEDWVTTVPLLDRALCTSGDYENYLVSGGKAWHHVFDPRTGRNPEREVVSVSVLAQRVVGPDKAAEVFAHWPGQELGAWFLLPEAGGGLCTVKVGWPAGFAADGSPESQPR
jgi:thiamine biosynthesis lipoprotein